MSYYELMVGWEPKKYVKRNGALDILIKEAAEMPIEKPAEIYEVTEDGYRVKVWPNK